MDFIATLGDGTDQPATYVEEIVAALADATVQAALALLIETVLTELLAQQAQESTMPGAYQRQGGF